MSLKCVFLKQKGESFMIPLWVEPKGLILVFLTYCFSGFYLFNYVFGFNRVSTTVKIPNFILLLTALQVWLELEQEYFLQILIQALKKQP